MTKTEPAASADSPASDGGDSRPLNSLLAAIESSSSSSIPKQEQPDNVKFDALDGSLVSLSFASTSGRNRPKQVCAVPSVKEENPLYKSVSMVFALQTKVEAVRVGVEVVPQDSSSASKLYILDKSKNNPADGRNQGKSGGGPEECSTSAQFELDGSQEQYALLLKPVYVSRRNAKGAEDTKGKCTRFIVNVTLNGYTLLSWSFRLYCPRYGARLPKTRECMFNSTPSRYLLRCSQAEDDGKKWYYRIEDRLPGHSPSTPATAPGTLSLSRESSMDETPGVVASQSSEYASDDSNSSSMPVPSAIPQVPEAVTIEGEERHGDRMDVEGGSSAVVVGLKRSLSLEDVEQQLGGSAKRQKVTDSPQSPTGELVSTEHLSDSPPLSDDGRAASAEASRRVPQVPQSVYASPSYQMINPMTTTTALCQVDATYKTTTGNVSRPWPS